MDNFDGEWRDCYSCDGTGEYCDGDRCPFCGGSGMVWVVVVDDDGEDYNG